ncbi:unnamed protein product, partial [marine sediment metagenome]
QISGEGRDIDLFGFGRQQQDITFRFDEPSLPKPPRKY